MHISLILTVKNEASSLPHLLDSVLAQTRAPDEIIVVDGGSTDDTLEVLHAYAQRLPLNVISLPGANISQGRNAAIRAAHGQIICSTDAGVRLDSQWVEELTQPFDFQTTASGNGNITSVDVISGFFVPDPKSIFEIALAATTLPALSDIHPDNFAPSSRSVAFRKEAWERVDGYPVWLDYCEDLIFDFALRDAGYHFMFKPSALVYFRPRINLSSFFKQYYHYARGDGKADLWFRRHLIRYMSYLIALPVLIALSFFAPMLALLLWLIAGAIMFYTPYKRLFPILHGLSFVDKGLTIICVPIIRVTGDIAKMIGYPVGVVWRLRHPKSVL